MRSQNVCRFGGIAALLLLTQVGLLTFSDRAAANAQTKTCGTPGGPTCPGPAPLPEPFSFRSLTAQAHGAGPFASLSEAWNFTANVDQPNSNKCSPTGVSFSQPATSWGVTPGFLYSPNVLMNKDSWSVNFTSVSWANPPPGEAPCITQNPGGEEILATRQHSCSTDGSISYTASGPIGPSCTTPPKSPGDPPPMSKLRCESKPQSRSVVGNPCNVSNGDKVQREPDYQGPNGLSFTRTYHSIVAYKQWLGAFSNSGYRQRTTLGVAWAATFLQYIVEVPTTDASGNHSTIHAFRPDGHIVTFVKYLGVYVPEADNADQVTMSGSGFIYRTEDDTVETYDMQGRLTSVTPRGGVTLTVAYASSDAHVPSTVSDPFGHTLTFGYLYDTVSKSYKLKTLTDPAGGVTIYGYDSSKRLVSVTFPDTRSRAYGYGTTGNEFSLTELTDEASVLLSQWSYSAGDGMRVLSSSRAGGVETYTIAYPTGSTPRMVTDPLGTVRTFSQQTILGDTKTTGVSAVFPGHDEDASRTFDANGNFDTRTDFKGNVTTYSHDLDRNLETSRTEAFGTARARTIATAWHATYRLPTSITEANRTTSFAYFANGNIQTRTVTDTSITPNVSRIWTYSYNAFGKVLTENGPRTDLSDVTTYTYYTCNTGSQCGQLNTITNALSHVTTFNSYNAHGQPTRITDANGLVTSLGYDARQRLTQRCVGGTLPSCTGGELTAIEYWPTGLLKKVTSPDGSFVAYTYDNAHRLTQIADGQGNRIVYTLDNAGNRTAENTYDISSNLKRTHTQVFNSLNQLWKDVNAAGTAAVTTTFGYDANGNQTTTNAPLSRNSTNAYDELDRLNQITDPASGVTAFAYDANDNLTQVTDPRSLVTSYTYTGFGDLKTQVSPDTGTATNSYDSGGNLDTSTDARGAVADYAYDALNRVTSVSYTLASVTDQTISYTYDSESNQKGHLTGASDANHSLSWTYDAQGRVTGKGQTVSAITKSIGYGYNADGQLASMVLPSGKTITYGYNANNQVSSVTLNGSPNVTIISNITYDPFGPITGWTWGNSTTASRTFDTDGKLTDITSSGQRTFGYDDAFRITGVTDAADSTKSWTLGYDLLDRLNAATKTALAIGYTYDANGNRLSQTGTSASMYTMSGSSNKLSSTSGVLSRSFSHDAAGNTTASGATVHSYNNANRMKTGRLAGGSDTSYVYNALGQRVKKSGGAIASPLYFMYDEAGHLVGEYDSSGNLIQETVWLGDIPVATLRPNGGNVDVFYVHTDQLNAPRKISRPSDNALRWRWDPTPFGEGVPDQNPASIGTFVYNLRFPGQQFDVESNFNYNYFRDYDAALGRYVESDPIGLDGGLSTFSYVQGDPLARVDEEGLADKKPDDDKGHTTNRRESNRETHEQGDARRQRDQHGGEKGDRDGRRRLPTKRPSGYKKGPWPPKPKPPVSAPMIMIHPCAWAPELMPPGYCIPYGPPAC
jgi:RHS repeat-associated protein